MLARVKRYYMFAKQTKDTVFDFTTPYVRLLFFISLGWQTLRTSLSTKRAKQCFGMMKKCMAILYFCKLGSCLLIICDDHCIVWLYKCIHSHD
mmetsp:Transcript_17026/g.25259  ORF Transcript_17026/g.25259 Transcript_17026/m.25259 type:complete len:93 (+) Transcript_17026:1728-2006(+)